jgi:hypothetical protein
MDFLSAILDFLNVTDNCYYIKKDIKRILDKNEYLGPRILSFLSLTITIIVILFLIYLVYKIIKQHT